VKLFISTLAIAVLAIGISVSTQADLNDGVIAAWTFDDGKATDAVGNAHGELFKAAKIVGKGKFGKALDVDGSEDTRVDIEFNADLEKAIEGPHTVSYWLYVRTGANHSGVWKGEKVGWGAHFTFRMVTTSDTGLTWGTTSGGAENWFATDGAIEAEEWFLLCQTADGKEAIAYVAQDGKKPEIPASGQANPQVAPEPYNLFPDRPLELGAGRQIAGNAGNDTFLDGMIDDVILWDRALSEDEVADLASGKRPDKALAVKAEGKVTTTWGKVKSYHRR
jgi:hypothetical protein